MSNIPYQAIPSSDSIESGTTPSYPPTPSSYHPGPSSSQSQIRAKAWRHFRPIYLVPAAALTLMAMAFLSKHPSTSAWRARPDSVLKYKEGYAYVPDDEDWRGEHPILELINRAERIKREMDQTRELTRTLEGAVRDYVAKFGMRPPEGFEQWHAFTLSINGTTAPSLIPFAHTSVQPYLAVPPELLHQRVPELQTERGIFGMTFRPERGGKYGQDGEENSGWIEYTSEDDVVGYMSPRWDYPLILDRIMPFVPPNQQPETPVQMSVCVKDGSCRLSSGMVMSRSRELAQNGEVWDKAELEQWEERYREPRGWPNTCPPPPDMAPYAKTSRSFVYNYEESMDFCRHPELVDMNGEMIMESQHIMRPLAPMLAVSRLSHGADMIGTPTRGVNDTSESGSWASKSLNKVVWRGTITGMFHRDRWPWRTSQRERASFLGSARDNQTVLDVLMELGEHETGIGTELVGVKKGDMVRQWLDIGVIEKDLDNMCGVGPTGEACRIDGDGEIPCGGANQACEDMKNEIQWVGGMENSEALKYKYRMDVDGYGWSSRFRKVLYSNSMIIKPTVYPEWWTEQAIPWYHLVPLRYDMSDLFDILSFFDGPPGSAGSANGNGIEERQGAKRSREEYARTIADRGKAFAEQNLRWEDMQSYMLLLLLEYRRAWSLDRQAATYQG